MVYPVSRVGCYYTVAGDDVMRGKILPISIALFLFFLPFFWFKPGFMDLGGDSSRLYFYDPISYLRNYSLFAVSPSNIGAENIGFMTIPLVLFLAAVKGLLQSPTIVINAFHGMSLMVAFSSVYLSIRILLSTIAKSQKFTEHSALAGGLLYVFSPISVYGWDKVLMTHNHVFLNPLMFYLLLRYVTSDRFFYLFWALLVTFVFSANFSFVSAPVFFAFYPATVLALLIIKLRILKTTLYWKHVIIASGVFVFLQAFHILPQVVSMFTPGSVLYTSVFSDQGKFDRGLGYFSAIAPSIKASVNVLLIPQMSKTFIFQLFMVFVPITVVLGLFQSYKESLRYRKTIVLVSAVFLVIFFFATANITDVGLLLYKKLFVLPGFSIYRNFYGQWASAYLFYYVLLFGVALAVVLPMHKKIRIALGVFLVFILINARPFLNGSLINPVLWKSTNSRIAMNMDPVFVQSVEYMRQLPSDGKVLTLPMTDPGYQIVAGKDTGAYQGPSMISYLAGKQDFAGALELGRFSAPFLESVKKGDTETIKKILGLLNIRYIFYDSDPRVYDAFPAFPYEDVRKYFPADQEGYSAFVRSLSLPLIQSFGNRFFIYELPKEDIKPRIYIPDDTYAVSQKENASMSLLLHMMRSNTSAFIEETAMDIADSRWYPLHEYGAIFRTVKNPYPPRFMHHAFATTPVSSMLYPFITAKEVWTLQKADKAGYVSAIDRREFLSAKRVLELEQWGEYMPVLSTIRSLSDLRNIKTLSEQPFEISRILNVSEWQNLNSWEAVLLRYYLYFDAIISLIDEANESDLWKTEQRFIVSEYLLQHQRRITDVIRIHSSLEGYKEYLSRISGMVFGDLLERAQSKLPDLSVPYIAQLSGADMSSFELYIDRASFDMNESISVSDGSAVYRSTGAKSSDWERLGLVTKSAVDESIVVDVSTVMPDNLISEESRMPLEVSGSHTAGAVNIDMRYIKNTQGIAWRINNWLPKSYYLLKFTYRTEGEQFFVRVMETDIKASSTEIPTTLVNDMLVSSKWMEYQAVIRSDVLANTGYVQIAPVEDQMSVSRIELKNVTLVHIPYPSIALMQNGKRERTVQPSISFVQRDPTLYNIHISGAVKPYFLVLNEGASSRWRLAVLPKSKKTDNMAWNTWWVSVSDFVDRIVPKRRKIIASDQHYSANIYANAWYIQPDDVEGQSEYELELYMTTQSYFYIGAGISMLMLMGLLLYGVKRYVFHA